MRKVFRFFCHISYLFFALLAIASPVNKYEWMWEMDPSIPPGAIEGGDEGVLVIAMLLIVMVLIQLVSLIFARKKSERILSGVFILLAVLIGCVKFYT